MFRSKMQKISKVGSGGFGVVYKALVEGVSGTVAVKELLPGSSSRDRERFEREVRIQSKLSHDNILPILACDLDADPPWYAMPLAPGSLADEMATLSFETERLLYIFRQILEGMKYAHGNGVIHRDLKPENILLFPNDIVAISDFGLGKRIDPDTLSTKTLTYTGDGLGTIAYAAPEQIRNFKSADGRSDIYSLGKILYEALTGDTPFPDLQIGSVEDRYRYIVAKCTDLDPEKRYQTIDELIADLERSADVSQFRSRLAETEANLKDIFSQMPSRIGVQKLDRILTENSNSETIYLEFVPKIKGGWLEAYVTHSPENFRRVLRQFDHYVSGELPFAYCDTVANFYREAYDRLDNPSVRRLILSRLLHLGVSHNRWYVQGIFCNLIGRIGDHTTAHVAVDVIKANPWAIAELSQQLLEAGPVKLIEDAILEAVNKTDTSDEDLAPF